MKRFIYIIMCAALLFTSCDKWPENGDLDGQWHLMELTPAGETAQDVHSQGIYWEVHLSLIVIHTTHDTLNGSTNHTTATFEHKGKNLSLTALYIHEFTGDEIITDPNTTNFTWTGIYGNKADFRIERLDSKRMILENERVRLVFRKLG